MSDQRNHVMKDVERSPEHAALTRRFVGTLIIAVIAIVVALGLFAIRYALTDPSERLGLLIALLALLVVAVVFGVFTVRYSIQINRLSRGQR